MDTLYSYGVERLAADRLLEERWMNRIMYVLSYFRPPVQVPALQYPFHWQHVQQVQQRISPDCLRPTAQHLTGYG